MIELAPGYWIEDKKSHFEDGLHLRVPVGRDHDWGFNFLKDENRVFGVIWQIIRDNGQFWNPSYSDAIRFAVYWDTENHCIREE